MSSVSFFVVLLCVPINSFVNGNYQGIPTADTIQDILRRLNDLEQRDRQQEEELDALRTENVGLRKSKVDMATEIDRLKKRDSQLVERIEQLEDQMRGVTTKLVKEINHGTDSFEEISKLTEEVLEKTKEQNISGEIRNLPPFEKELKIKSGHNLIRQLGQGTTVAFLATRSSSHAVHLGQHQPVVFERTITNVGNAYYNSTGIFIAPESGIYVFSATILAENEAAHFQFAINGRGYTIMYAHSTERFETLSQTVIFSLSKGDDVAIQSYDSDKSVYGSDYSTFSGFLLGMTEGDIVVG